MGPVWNLFECIWLFPFGIYPNLFDGSLLEFIWIYLMGPFWNLFEFMWWVPFGIYLNLFDGSLLEFSWIYFMGPFWNLSLDMVRVRVAWWRALGWWRSWRSNDGPHGTQTVWNMAPMQQSTNDDAVLYLLRGTCPASCAHCLLIWGRSARRLHSRCFIRHDACVHVAWWQSGKPRTFGAWWRGARPRGRRVGKIMSQICDVMGVLAQGGQVGNIVMAFMARFW